VGAGAKHTVGNPEVIGFQIVFVVAGIVLFKKLKWL